MQVHLAGHVASSTAIDVASAAQDMARSPRATITKPIRHLASYLPNPMQGNTLPNGHNPNVEGRVMTPLLSTYTDDRRPAPDS